MSEQQDGATQATTQVTGAMNASTHDASTASSQQQEVTSDTAPLGPDLATADLIGVRNRALREAAALRTILGAHGISVDLDVNKLTSLPVEGGAVVGTYDYTPPKIVASGNTGNSRTVDVSGAITVDDIKSMTHKQINDNWEKVQEVLKRGV